MTDAKIRISIYRCVTELEPPYASSSFGDSEYCAHVVRVAKYKYYEYAQVTGIFSAELELFCGGKSKSLAFVRDNGQMTEG